MIWNEGNFSFLRPCLHSMRLVPWNFSCILCRLGSCCLLILAVICFVFNIRFIFNRQRRNHLVFSLIVASCLVLTVSMPGTLIQLFTCHRHCLNFYCRLEGFFSYLSGCVCMLILMMLAIHRFLSLCSYRRHLSYRCSNYGCWFFSIVFTLPLMFDYFNSYVPEGLGFHCSLNWQDRSAVSRLYIFTSFSMIYFLPFILLIYFSLRVHFILRKIYNRHGMVHLLRIDTTQTSSTIASRRDRQAEQVPLSHYVREAKCRKRFQINYQFLRAMIFLICNYMIAWTPYSIVAILQLLQIDWIFQHSYLMTLTAFLGKSSVILTPLIYLRIMNKTLFHKILLY